MDKRGLSETRLGYVEIASEIEAQILTGAFPAGTFLPTEKSLQTQFGVSRTTVRRALSALVDRGLCESAPNRGVIVAGKRRRSRRIAFVDGASTILQKLFGRMSALLLEHDYHLVHVESHHRGLGAATEVIEERDFDAAFIWSNDGFPDVKPLEALRQKVPMVVLDHRIPHFDADLVTFDYQSIAREVVKRLADDGHKNIAVTGMLDMLDVTQARFQGYMLGLYESGLCPHASNYLFNTTSGQSTPDTRLLRMRLQEADRPDAVFVLQDEFVPATARAILDADFSIPEDVGLATIGDDVLVSIQGYRIRTAHSDWNHFAELAVATLLERMEKPNRPFQTRLAGHQLIEPTQTEETPAPMYVQSAISGSFL